MLFEMLLLLEIKLLSSGIIVEWLNVFVLFFLTDRYHIDKELFKDYPTLISESQLDESDDFDGGDSLDFDSD